MKIAVRLVSVLVLVAFGCSPERADDATQDNPGEDLPDGGEPDPADEPDLPDEPEPPVAKPVVLPEIWGVRALQDLDPDPDVVEVELTAEMKEMKLSEDIRLNMMTYNGRVPGPLLHAKVGDRVKVHFRNDLDEPTTVHWHGLRDPADMDGSPRIMDPVPPGGTFEYDFVVPDAGSYWYHPHVRSNEQVEKGLQGVLVVRDANDPTYDQERYIVLDDVLLSGSSFAGFLQSHPEIMHGRSGNVLLTNGRPSVLSGVADEGHVERWRLVNTANARTMSVGVEGASFRVIGTDGGLLAEPFETDRLEIAVGQRYDLEVRYDRPGAVQAHSYVLSRNQAGELVDLEIPVMDVEAAETGRAPAPPAYPELEPLVEPEADMVVDMAFNGRPGGQFGTEWTINGEANPEEPIFECARGDVVLIRLENQAGPEHPFHLHGQFFTVIDDGQDFTDRPGLRDTVLLPGMSSMSIIARMDNPGEWMAHCHILEHAELGMMAQVLVTD